MTAKRSLRLVLTAAIVLPITFPALAHSTIETDGNVQAQGFIGDGSQVTNVDAATLDGNDSGDFAGATETAAVLAAFQAQLDALLPLRPDPPCFNTTQRIVDCGNGTVTDTVTGLIYLQYANCFGQQDWPTANQSAAGLADGLVPIIRSLSRTQSSSEVQLVTM